MDILHDFMIKLLMIAQSDAILKLVCIAVMLDTVFGCIRAIKDKKFNSCFGIDGAIRKASMVISLIGLVIIDQILNINLIGFLPENASDWIIKILNIKYMGLAQFFGILYIAYETVSILKNMTLCGLPVKGVWRKCKNFLLNYTDELPDDDGLEEKDDTNG